MSTKTKNYIKEELWPIVKEVGGAIIVWFIISTIIALYGYWLNNS